MPKTRGGGVSRGRGGSQGGRPVSQGSVRQPRNEDPEEHPPHLREIISQELSRILRDSLPEIVREAVRVDRPQQEMGTGGAGGAGGADGAGGAGRVEAPKPKGCTFKEFLDCKPPELQGGEDPSEALNWLTFTEEMFETCNVAEADKVGYATKFLRGNSHYWWNMMVNTLGRDLARLLTWDHFPVKFEEEYCSGVTVRALEEEFLHLEQGTMTVQQYTMEFNQKARFAQHQVDTERRKIDRYAWGLKTEIREFVKPSEYTVFRQIVEAAKERERELNRQSKEKKIDKSPTDLERKGDGKQADNSKKQKKDEKP